VQGIVDAVNLDVVAKFTQLFAVSLSLVAQRVEFGGDDQGARLVAQVAAQDGRIVRVLQVLVARAVERHVIDHPLGGQQVALAVGAHRIEGRIFRVVVVGGRVE